MPYTIDDFRNRKGLVRLLASQLVRGRLTVILGAGISIPFGLPDWASLVKGLYRKNGKRTQNGETPERLAEYARTAFYSGRKQQFLQDLHEVLYKMVDVDFAHLQLCSTLSALGTMLAASRRGQVSSVITLNFDNLLELYLRYMGVVVLPVFKERHWAANSDVTVYHPHGYIPYSLSEDHSDGNDIVIDQMSYSKIVGKEGNIWRQTMLTTMRRNFCIFIGLSGKDTSLDSILDSCSTEHIAMCANMPFWGVAVSTSGEKVMSTIWKNRGVYLCKVANYEVELPNLLLAICQEAASRAG